MMTYKETFYFVAKCLTISLEPENKKAIKKQLETKTINWDQVVKLSTSHYVFPALYCNLKRADFLKYLPADLVAYMEEITVASTPPKWTMLSDKLKLVPLIVTLSPTSAEVGVKFVIVGDWE